MSNCVSYIHADQYFFYLSDVWVKGSLIQGYVYVSSLESEVIPRSMMYDSTSENKGKYG